MPHGMLEKQDAVWLSHKSHPIMMYRKKTDDISHQVREFKMNAIIESLPCTVAKPRAYQSKENI